MKINVLCIGDIVGRPGRRILSEKLHHLVNDLDVDCVIANAENAAGGSGLTPQIYEKLLRYGVHMVTLGDHTYRKRVIIPTLETADNITRPGNISEFSAGKAVAYYKTQKGPTVAVVNLIGRIFMKPADCPYNAADKILAKLEKKADIILVDFHAEATSDMQVMGRHLDGRVSAVLGTHTHVPTADEQILPGGTAFQCDVGMTGPHESILGRRIDRVVETVRTFRPKHFEVASQDVRITGTLVDVDPTTGKATSIRRLVVDESMAQRLSSTQS